MAGDGNVWTPAGAVRLLAIVPADQPSASAELHPDEVAYAAALPPARRAEWLAGRRALRSLAFDLREQTLPAVLVDPRGAPLLPPGVAASISHKRSMAGALLGHAPDAWVGLDLEDDAPTRSDLRARVLSGAERTALAGFDDVAHRHEQRRRFAVKEAIYKAVAPVVRRYVGFAEVTLLAADDGYLVDLHADDLARLEVTCGLMSRDGLLLAWAAARRR